MPKLSNETPWVTIFLCVITAAYALVGGALVIWGDPGVLSFDEYGTHLIGFCAALGLLGVGRGISKGLAANGNGKK